MPYLALYLAAVSLAAIILTVHDKRAARNHKWRVRESTLLLVSALGGSAAMLVTMLLIRHKTKHAKFMVGIPIIIVLQVALAAAVVWLRWKGGLP
ncbi:MAG: DUF1294 domain-containing protein [Oscillospiraceae bacterium]|jgi:uncharacterized membrane protein YsdA (DUF1294 family)|nr:DUF1294 domain-containing protein [Oscillospiraceae bacterium]